jgi:pimeloyl-ACP methyl ester carboxylesterase
VSNKCPDSKYFLLFGAFIAVALISTSTRAQPTWTRCPLITGGTDTSAECATTQVPLDWTQSKGPQISYFVKRLLGSGPQPHKQVWLIAGGPGSPGSTFEPLAQSWSQLDSSLDFYIPDHRGTGSSARLLCPQTEQCISSPNGELCKYSARNPLPNNLWANCLGEINQSMGTDYLPNFNMTNAAKDIRYGITLNRKKGQQVFVFGGSYGTVLVQRYLQVAPGQATGAIIKGFSTTGVMDLVQWDYFHNDIVNKIFEACAMDTTCNGKLGVDGSSPWEKVGQLLKQLQANPNYCLTDASDGQGGVIHNAPVTYDKLRGFMALYADVPAVRDTIPALVYRVARCSSEDKAAISQFRENFFQNATSPSPSTSTGESADSEILQNIISTSELIKLPVVIEDVSSEDQSLYVSAQVGLNLAQQANIPGTVYPRDSYFGAYPKVKQPMLMINGTLDPSTPFKNAAKVAAIYKNQSKNHYFFAVPRGGHTGEEDPTCTADIMEQFIKNPHVKPDGSCLAHQPKLDFVHKSDGIPQKLFSRDDLWE